jgi:hypothetical protein
MSAVNDKSVEFYTPREVEYLDKYGAVSDNLLDDEELYQIITKHNFNDEKILNEVKTIIKRIEARGEEYQWGNIQNGKKKIQKEEVKPEPKITKVSKPQKGRKPERDVQSKALQEENQIYYDYNKGYGNYKNYQKEDKYYNNYYGNSYNNEGYNQNQYQNYKYKNNYQGGKKYQNYNKYQKHQNQSQSASNDVIFEYNDEGKMVPKNFTIQPVEEVKEEITHSHKDEANEGQVIMKEIAESQALHKNKSSPVKQNPETEYKSKPVTAKPSPEKVHVESKGRDQKQPHGLSLSSDSGFHIQSQEPIQKEEPKKETVTQHQPYQQQQQFQMPGFEHMNHQQGFPGFFPQPMFPFQMYDPEAMKNMMGGMPQMQMSTDPKIQQQMQLQYMTMMNQMYMQMMMYKSMMQPMQPMQPNQGQEFDAFQNMFNTGKK